MKAIRYHVPGGVEVFRYEDRPDLVPGAGEAVVRIGATGVNFIEVYQRKGQYAEPLPAVPGSEAAGVVMAVGAGVSTVRVGDRVASESFHGSYAECAIAPAERLVRFGPDVSMETAAAVMLQGLTAHYLLYSTYPIRAGDWCVVHAAAGGVGLLLCQLARNLGAHVIATASSDAKRSLALGAGAEHAVDYAGLVAAVQEYTAGRGVDVVYDSVGQATFADSLRCIRRRGTLALFGQSSGPVPPVDPQVLNRHGSLFLTRPTLAHHVATTTELAERSSALFTWIRDKTLTVHVDRRYPLANAAEAHVALESRSTTGKLLLIP
jgi:NADPH2:quinone reductase